MPNFIHRPTQCIYGAKFIGLRAIRNGMICKSILPTDDVYSRFRIRTTAAYRTYDIIVNNDGYTVVDHKATKMLINIDLQLSFVDFGVLENTRDKCLVGEELPLAFLAE